MQLGVGSDPYPPPAATLGTSDAQWCGGLADLRRRLLSVADGNVDQDGGESADQGDQNLHVIASSPFARSHAIDRMTAWTSLPHCLHLTMSDSLGAGCSTPT